MHTLGNVNSPVNTHSLELQGIYKALVHRDREDSPFLGEFVVVVIREKLLPLQLADEAVCIGEAPSVASYLNIPNIIAAAVSRGADAIHPVRIFTCNAC